MHLDTMRGTMVPLVHMEDVMKMTRLNIQVPLSLKAKLDGLRATGTTAAGLIRHLLTQHFNEAQKSQKGR